MSLGIECLLCDDGGQASEMARELDALNQARRSVEAHMQVQAVELLEAMQLEEGGALPTGGLCLYDDAGYLSAPFIPLGLDPRLGSA